MDEEFKVLEFLQRIRDEHAESTKDMSIREQIKAIHAEAENFHQELKQSKNESIQDTEAGI